jgi:autotransporter translocation and assembly factor TamB
LLGPQTDPQLNGFVRIENCALKIPNSDLSFNRGQTRLTLYDKQITLDTLYFSAGQGFIKSKGTVVYSKKDIESVHISTFVKAVKMKRAGEFIATVDSALIQTEKKNDGYYLSGDIVLGETRLIKSIQPKALLAAIEKKPKPIRDIPAFSSRVHFNIRVLESDKIWIDNNLARLRLHSELALTGSMAQPVLSGRLSAKEGYILYLDRKFKIENGTLDFIDPNRINPVVELSALSNIKSYQTRSHIPYTVWLKIKGPLDEAIVELTSEPTLERSDIIALLTVGVTRDQIMGRYENGKAMTLSSILRERASELSGRQISGYVTRRMGGFLGLEEMTIEGNLFRFGKTWGPQLLASKKLNNRMEISYTTTAGDANEQNVRLDYKLSDHFSLEGETNQKGQSGLDLKYRLKFK